MLNQRIAKLNPFIFTINDLLQNICRKSLINAISLNNSQWHFTNDLQSYFIPDDIIVKNYHDNLNYDSLKGLIDAFNIKNSNTMVLVSLTTKAQIKPINDLLTTLAQKLISKNHISNWHCQLSQTTNQKTALITLLLTNDEQPQIIYSGMAIAKVIADSQINILHYDIKNSIADQVIDQIRPLFRTYTLWHTKNPWQYYQKQIQPLSEHEQVNRLKELITSVFENKLTEVIAKLNFQAYQMDYYRIIHLPNIPANKVINFNYIFNELKTDTLHRNL